MFLSDDFIKAGRAQAFGQGNRARRDGAGVGAGSSAANKSGMEGM
jgi:hypothetical protein